MLASQFLLLYCLRKERQHVDFAQGGKHFYSQTYFNQFGSHFIGIFDAEVQPIYTICGLHRCTLGIYWKGKRRFCQVPHEIAGHKKERAKGDRAVSAEIARQIFLQTSSVVSVGSSKVPPFLFT